jgi:uncharacterized MAPEG superfamily protein
MKINYSFYTVPLAYVITILPHIFSMHTYQSATNKSFPIKQPRGFATAVQSDQALDNTTRNRILRAEAAHANGMENIGLFAAAIVAGNTAGVDPWWLNVLSAGYLLSRFIYNHVYIFNDLVPGELRSVTHFGGLSAVFGLFVLAGNKVR